MALIFSTNFRVSFGLFPGLSNCSSCNLKTEPWEIIYFKVYKSQLPVIEQALESAAGRQVRGYRAPSYSITRRSLWALDVLIEEGYQYDASIYPIFHDRYGIPDAPRHVHKIKRPSGRPP